MEKKKKTTINKKWGITAQQKSFCDKYLAGKLNGTQAAIKAGYGAKNAHVTASRLLANDKIKNYLEKHTKEILSATDMNTLRWINEIRDGLDFSLQDVSSWNDTDGVMPYKSESLDKEKAKWINEISSTTNATGDVNFKIKGPDRIKLLTLFSKLLPLVQDPSTITLKTNEQDKEDKFNKDEAIERILKKCGAKDPNSQENS